MSENAPVRFEIRHRDDLWEVLRDGQLRGGYISRSGALAAVRSAMREVTDTGAEAEMVPPLQDNDQ